MLIGETVNDRTTVCACGETLTIAVQKKGLHYYVGYECSNCGPYSKESNYFDTREGAERALETGMFDKRPGTSLFLTKGRVPTESTIVGSETNPF